MKPNFLLTHLHHPAFTRPQTAVITRQRASYLLRAARSRRLAKVESKPEGYFLPDCSITLSKIA